MPQCVTDQHSGPFLKIYEEEEEEERFIQGFGEQNEIDGRGKELVLKGEKMNFTSIGMIFSLSFFFSDPFLGFEGNFYPYCNGFKVKTKKT